MSTETILSRMMSDAKFAEAVFTDAAQALAEYNLPAEELAKFQTLTRAHFEGMNAEERKSFLVDWGGRSAASLNHNETTLTIYPEGESHVH